tara:strand:+ start:160 stop:423 length:264 start_codon:yes stop_codon:yes gene_type:complete
VEFKKRTNESYPQLFSTESEGFDTSAEGAFNEQYGWFGSFYTLSGGGDITKFEAIERLPMSQCLTYLSFVKQKTELEAKKIKDARRR